jgi:hypothetical protein
MAWRRKSKKPAPIKAPPAPAADGPRRTTLPDGTVIEDSAAMGRSVIVPGTPARVGLDIRPDAPAWGWRGLRRLFGR